MQSRNPDCARLHVVAGVAQKDHFCPSRKEMRELLAVLKAKPDVDLQWGDLVAFADTAPYRNDGLTIYNGTELVDLYPEPDQYGTLPPMFKVLEKHPVNGQVIPIGYWHSRAHLPEHKQVLAEEEPKDRFIAHNNIVWFDHRPFAKELLSNVAYDDKQYNHPALCSRFKNPADGNVYYIVVDITDEPEYDYHTNRLSEKGLVRLTKAFTLMLSSDLLAHFKCNDVCGVYNVDHQTLFWDPASELADWERYKPDYDTDDE